MIKIWHRSFLCLVRYFIKLHKYLFLAVSLAQRGLTQPNRSSDIVDGSQPCLYLAGKQVRSSIAPIGTKFVTFPDRHGGRGFNQIRFLTVDARGAFVQGEGR